MKNPPTLSSGQFSPVTAAKGIMKKYHYNRYKRFCNTHFQKTANLDKCNFVVF